MWFGCGLVVCVGWFGFLGLLVCDFVGLRCCLWFGVGCRLVLSAGWI